MRIAADLNHRSDVRGRDPPRMPLRSGARGAVVGTDTIGKELRVPIS
jgi:hypothetical protein